jgi:hypothetical protein
MRLPSVCRHLFYRSDDPRPDRASFRAELDNPFRLSSRSGFRLVLISCGFLHGVTWFLFSFARTST